jgi:hypothetical protein
MQYTWEERESGMAKDEPSIPHYLAHETAVNSGFVQDVDHILFPRRRGHGELRLFRPGIGT